MKKWLISLLLITLCLFAKTASGQIFTQTFIDKCSGQVKIATTTIVNGNSIVSFYGQVRSFTPAQVASGELQIWLQTTYAYYNSLACPVAAPVVTQTVQNTVSQAASQAASSAASSAARAAAIASYAYWVNYSYYSLAETRAFKANSLPASA